MTVVTDGLSMHGTSVVRMENEHLTVDVAPGVGGRIVSIVDKCSGYEFLWRNAAQSLGRLPPGSPYDPSFFGGVDELIPNDRPEAIDGLDCPDHGELWTMALAWTVEGGALVLSGVLPLFGLTYERRMVLRDEGPHLDLSYRIGNPTAGRRHFLWRLHPALKGERGDIIECPARRAQADPQWSRWGTMDPFEWPFVEGQRADVMPAPDGTTDCLFLYDLDAGKVGWRSTSRALRFEVSFDTAVFPYVCYFASYGGFYGHYVIIPGPSSAMPVSVNEAARMGQCSVLAPGETLDTRVTLYAGR